MSKKFSFWIWGTIITQLLTAVFHSVSFFVKPEAKNDTEKQLIDLMTSYKQDMGMGFNRSMGELVTGLSISFTLICLFGALLNWTMKRKNIAADTWKAVLQVQLFIFGALAAATLVFTFPPPIICTLLIFIFICGAYLSISKNV